MGSLPVTEARVRLQEVHGRVDPLDFAGLCGRGSAALAVRGWTVIVGEPVGVVDDLEQLDVLAEAVGWRTPVDTSLPPFLGGAIGYVAEHAGDAWLTLPPDPRPAAPGLQPFAFTVHDTAACLPPADDPDADRTLLVAGDVPGWTREPAADRLNRLAARVDRARARPASSPTAAARDQTAHASLDARAHAAAVERVQEWISAGDLYQLNLTLQLAVPWPAPPLDLARRLWTANPGAAHAAWLDLGGAQIVSVSPETFLRCDGDEVVVRPIKGTRPRSPDDAEADDAAAHELEHSAKDRAEHVMIVDLERNDLGRVCEIGSVRVPELLALEAHPTVWHLTSTVSGRLAPSTRLSDLLAALFPCGSVTGAPKRMAVARTRLVEPVRRGVYCGAIGAISQGLVDLSVGIRTATVAGATARYGAGGGIVADSDPSAEYEEAMDKAAAFARATGARLPRS